MKKIPYLALGIALVVSITNSGCSKKFDRDLKKFDKAVVDMFDLIADVTMDNKNFSSFYINGGQNWEWNVYYRMNFEESISKVEVYQYFTPNKDTYIIDHKNDIITLDGEQIQKSTLLNVVTNIWSYAEPLVQEAVKRYFTKKDYTIKEVRESGFVLEGNTGRGHEIIFDDVVNNTNHNQINRIEVMTMEWENPDYLQTINFKISASSVLSVYHVW